MNAPVMDDLLKLDVETRLEIVSQLWDSIVDSAAALPLADEERDVLARRLEAYRRDPDAGAPWADVRARVFRGGRSSSGPRPRLTWPRPQPGTPASASSSGSTTR